MEKKKVSLPRKRKPSTRKRSPLQAKNEEFSTPVKKRPVINYFESTSILSVALSPLGICQGLCPQRGICNQTSAPREKIFVVVVYVFGDLHWGSLRYCGVKEFFVWYSVIVYYCAWVDRLLAWVDFWHAVVLSYFRPSLGYFFGFLVHYPIPNPILYLLRIHIILL